MQRGRPRVATETINLNVLLTPKQLRFLRWNGNGNASRGLRALLDKVIAAETAKGDGYVPDSFLEKGDDDDFAA